MTETNILTHPSKPRNRCLFQAARKLRIAEETGCGVDRMFRELLRSGHSTPTPGLVEPTRESARPRRPEFRLRTSALGLLGSSVSYHRRTVDDIGRKVTAHVNEYGRISNRTIQNLLDIDVYRARDLLRDLRDRGILVKTSQQERGAAVAYGPGETKIDPIRPHL